MVGVINRQMTLSDASAVGECGRSRHHRRGGCAAPARGGVPDRFTHAQAARSPRAMMPAASGSAASATGGQQPRKSARRQPETAANGLMDGLKIVAKNGHAKADEREERLKVGQPPVIFDTADSPACTDCGSIMVRNGSCYKCINCGSTSGCS